MEDVRSCEPCKGRLIKKYTQIRCPYCGETSLYDWAEMYKKSNGHEVEVSCPVCSRTHSCSMLVPMNGRLDDMFNFVYVVPYGDEK